MPGMRVSATPTCAVPGAKLAVTLRSTVSSRAGVELRHRVDRARRLRRAHLDVPFAAHREVARACDLDGDLAEAGVAGLDSGQVSSSRWSAASRRVSATGRSSDTAPVASTVRR